MNVNHRFSWHGEGQNTDGAMTSVVNAVPTVYWFRSPHLCGCTN